MVSSAAGLFGFRLGRAIHGLHGGEITEVTESVREAAHLARIRHDRRRTSLEERVVTAPDIDDVFRLRAAHRHDFHPVAEHLRFLKPFRLSLAFFLRAHSHGASRLYTQNTRMHASSVSRILLSLALSPLVPSRWAPSTLQVFPPVTPRPSIIPDAHPRAPASIDGDPRITHPRASFPSRRRLLPTIARAPPTPSRRRHRRPLVSLGMCRLAPRAKL